MSDRGQPMAGFEPAGLRRPEPARPAATPAALAAVLAAASLAAWLLPFAPIGINLFLVALAAGVAVYVARPGPVSPMAWVYTGLGLALAGTAAVRDAEWVLQVNLLAALVLAGLAAAEAVTARDIVLAPFGYLRPLLRAPAYLAGAIPRGAVTDRGRSILPVLRAGVIAAAVVGVFGILFASADRAFAELAERVLFPGWDLDSIPVRVFVFLFAAGSVATLAVVRHRDRDVAFVGRPPWSGEVRGPRLRRLDWTAGLVGLDLLFAVFVAIQIAVLFGGHDHVVRTAGLTYAEYARQGFFQLLVVAALVLGVLLAVAYGGERRGLRDDRRMQVLAGTLCLLTVVVLASAMHRLALYEETFGYSRDRLAVRGVLWWIAGLLLLAMVAGALRRGSWLARGAVVWTASALLVFTAVNPDGLVAERNVGRHSRTGKLGLGYLRSTMSADAVPALLALPAPLRSCVLRPLADRLSRDEPWMAFNLARNRARTILENPSTFDQAGACPPAGVTP